jgi:hypothetical protein
MQTQLAEIAAAGECAGKLLFEERFSARISTDGRTRQIALRHLFVELCDFFN